MPTITVGRVQSALCGALQLVDRSRGTVTSFALCRSGALFGVFEAFDDVQERVAPFQMRPEPGSCLYVSSLGMT